MRSYIREALPMEIHADGSLLIIERIAPLEELEHGADERDLHSIEAFTSPRRRAERLAWRKVLRRICPQAEVEYDPSGAPQIKNSPYTHISVSHCRDYVAVALSHRTCGVDIERMDRDFSRVAPRYMTSAESSLISEEWWLAAVWCAKECIYKMGGCEGVDFCRDISIVGVNTSTREISCRSIAGEHILLQYVMPDAEHIVVYAL